MESALEAITVLVVEDDEGDALLVGELLEAARPRMRMIREAEEDILGSYRLHAKARSPRREELGREVGLGGPG